jgi:hypothetical protein
MEVVRHKHWLVEEVAEPRKNTRCVAYHMATHRRLGTACRFEDGFIELLHKAMMMRWSVPPGDEPIGWLLDFPDYTFGTTISAKRCPAGSIKPHVLHCITILLPGSARLSCTSA